MDSIKGQYMLHFAELIQRIKSHPLQKNEPVFFLCENVKGEWKDQRQFEPVFGISAIIIDAQQISPSRRLRAYFTNVSLVYCIAIVYVWIICVLLAWSIHFAASFSL